MANKNVTQHARWINGISDFAKEGTADSYYFGRGVDHRSDPRSIKLNPRAVNESGSIVEDLPKWGEIVGTNLYVYGDTGKIYKRTSAGVWTKIRQAPNSHGNGLSYFGEDNFIYYTTDTTIGRYGPVSGSPQFYDDFLGAQGGVPLNTNALQLLSASSQYAYRADTASLSITGDLSLEAQVHPLSLPTTGNSMTLVSKWNESGNIRSYKFDITTESNYFGDGSDGALTISSNTTDAPIDSACTGVSGTTTLSATNVSFATGQIILIHQTRGTGAGTWQRNKIISYTAGTISLDTALTATYTSGAQVLVLKQYTNVTVDSGKTWTAKAWNGTVGGILAFLSSGTFTNNGTISASGSTGGTATGVSNTATGASGGGFRGGDGYIYNAGPSPQAQAGEGTAGAAVQQTSANGNGGGGGQTNSGGAFGGAGGGNGSSGSSSPTATGGNSSGNVALTTMTFGGGGGGCSFYSTVSNTVGAGGSGGGIVFISAVTLTNSGSITSNGGAGGSYGGGGGAGGSILLKAQTATLGTGTITASGGAAGTFGAAGSVGRIHIDYYTSYTGSTSPTIDATQDDTLGAVDGYVLRLQISSNGTAVTQFSKSVPILTDYWQHVAVSFDSATTGDATKCSAEFFYNGISLGTILTATQTISDNASEFFVGTNKNGAGTAVNFYNGYIDEVRVWNKVVSSSEYLYGINQQILTTTPYLQAYYKFNGDLNDATANANHLTGSGTPTYVTDVPFPSPTTRLDIDQSATTTGNTYTNITAISESSTNRLTFTPTKDPQKSIAVLVASAGTGNWTITVHDQYNQVIATATILNANIAVGYNEFVFSEPWRPLLNATYHFHVTSTVADGTMTTTNVNDLETVSYRTYFQFLVTDTEWHPVAKMLQFLVFGNERYVGTYEATLYDPNTITLPAGYRVRCFGYYKEYLAIGTMKGDTISEQEQGRIYFWDGISTTYNFYVDVPEGGINALLGAKGKLYVWAGYQGDILVYQGGDTTDQIKRVPLIADPYYMEVYPGAVNMYRMLIRFGVAGASDSTDLQRGVYTWGSQNVRYNDSLSYDFPISTGTYNSNVAIGLVTVVNKKLLVGWRDNVSYGVDVIEAANDAQPSGELVQLINDDTAVWKEKEALQIVANFEPLNSGESVTIKYKLDRASVWTYGEAITTAGETIGRLVIATGGSRYHEIQYGVDLATSVSTSPKILGLTIESDYLKSEERVG